MESSAPDSSAVAFILPHISASLLWVLAGSHMHEFDSGFLPTTNLMHAGYCQFMLVHEGS